MMNMIDRAIAALAPQAALRRAQARSALAHYDAAGSGRRVAGVRRSNADADTASARRERLSQFGRDLIRNTPFAVRAQQVITANVIGDGIVPNLIWPSGAPPALIERGQRLIEEWLDTTLIDAAGRLNLYGLQALIMQAVCADGECLVVEEWRVNPVAGIPPLRLRVLEIDHLDTTRDGLLVGNGYIKEGIEYDAQGARVAYWLFDEHPGGSGLRAGSAGLLGTSRRVDAHKVHHIYRVDRPGQERGVSWFAPVALTLLDFGDYQDAQATRQKIAACFAVFRIFPDGKPDGAQIAEGGAALEPGLIQDLYGEQEVQFANPPGVEGYDEFTRNTLRAAAAGLGITYEALTGDLSGVNFTSYKAGRMEMDRNVSGWQWRMMIPQFLQPLARSILKAWTVMDNRVEVWVEQARIGWTPPPRAIVDPAREYSALTDAVRSGFKSRSQVVRELGYDPARLLAEQKADADAAREAGLTFDSDGNTARAGAAAPPALTDQKKEAENG
jgi:lambda family phage portal protein